MPLKFLNHVHVLSVKVIYIKIRRINEIRVRTDKIWEERIIENSLKLAKIGKVSVYFVFNNNKGKRGGRLWGQRWEAKSLNDVIWAAGWRRWKHEVIFESHEKGEPCEEVKSLKDERIKTQRLRETH
jgi:hypothetical protein